MAVCDVIEQPVFKLLTKPDDKLFNQFDQQISRKMLAPLTKNLLTLHDADGKELYRFVDSESNLIDQLMGCCPGEWALLSEKTLVAKMVWIPREKVQQKGIGGWLKRFRAGSDRCLISRGNKHILPAPAALCLYLLYEDLTTKIAA